MIWTTAVIQRMKQMNIDAFLAFLVFKPFSEWSLRAEFMATLIISTLHMEWLMVMSSFHMRFGVKSTWKLMKCC